MLKGLYNKIKAGHAAAAMNARPELPGAEYGMTDAEIMRSVGQALRAGPIAQRATVQEIRNMDQTLYVGNGPQVVPGQFPKSWYMGEDDGGDYGI